MCNKPADLHSQHVCVCVCAGECDMWSGNKGWVHQKKKKAQRALGHKHTHTCIPKETHTHKHPPTQKHTLTKPLQCPGFFVFLSFSTENNITHRHTHTFTTLLSVRVHSPNFSHFVIGPKYWARPSLALKHLFTACIPKRQSPYYNKSMTEFLQIGWLHVHAMNLLFLHIPQVCYWIQIWWVEKFLKHTERVVVFIKLTLALHLVHFHSGSNQNCRP